MTSKLRHNRHQKAKKAKKAKPKVEKSPKLTSIAVTHVTLTNGTSESPERGIVTKPGTSSAFTATPHGPFSRTVDEVLADAVRRVLDDLTHRKEGQAT